MTLGADDVALARHLLRNRECWEDGKLVAQYESEFAKWNGSEHAFAFMGGRVALSGAIYALGLRPGDEVIVPGYTCVVVPNAFRFVGVKVVYGDIELETFGLAASGLEKKVTPRTRAILLQHLYGLVCRDYEVILDFAKRHNLRVIEDCAHATGASYKGIKVGNRGDIGFYSSEQSKIFNTTQGGLAVTNDPGLARKLGDYYQKAVEPDRESISNLLKTLILNYQLARQDTWALKTAILRYGKNRSISTSPEEMSGIRPTSYGARMPPAIAAIGLNQLRKIDGHNDARRQAARRWDDWVLQSGYKKPLVISNSTPVYLRYPVLVEPEKKRSDTWAKVGLGVELGVWYLTHIHPAPEKVVGCPNADIAVGQCVNFPTILSSPSVQESTAGQTCSGGHS